MLRKQMLQPCVLFYFSCKIACTLILLEINIILGMEKLIKSMTGYGKGEGVLHNRKFVVEIKAVNHRYNDITIKMPRIMNSFEDKIRTMLSAEISRGKTDVYINYETFSKDDIKINLNTVLADAYAEQLLALRNNYSGFKDDISLALIAKFPDVINVERNVENEDALSQMWEALTIALNGAVAQFVAMRCREGEALKVDLLKKNAIIKQLAKSVEERSPLVVEEYRKRLSARIAEALGDIAPDESRLLTEITIFADKSSIDEEVTRLSSHLEQMEAILQEDDSVGRKLDFLVQEMNREANTIASKSSDLELTRLAIDIKSEIEKIREQVQNIE